MPATRIQRFAIIGYGAIADEVVRVLDDRGELASLAGILVRPGGLAQAQRKAANRFPIVSDIDGLCDLAPDIVAECAGHEAMRQFGSMLLMRRIDVLCSSVGVLADRDFAEELSQAAGAAKLWIPSGAIAGIDGLLAARTAGLDSVTYTSAKPPIAWRGTPADRSLNPAARERRTVFFTGTAREAAIAYPKNVNVGATVALAGIGLDRTIVALVSDPELGGPLGVIEASGAFGTFRFEVLAYASPNNPKTSLLTAHSVIAAVQAGVCFSPAI